jgi:2,6-dihydroxypseudooxynicotine hydrolase
MEKIASELEHNRNRFPRLVAAGVDYNDLLRIVERVEKNDEEWGTVWEEFGSMHEQLGDEALQDGRTITAGEAFARAAVYFHVAQATNHHDVPEKERLQRRQHSVYRKAMPYLRPPVQPLQIPYKGSSFPGYLRLPEGATGPVPCVIMLAGLDSTKEELACYEPDYLERGIATFVFDGPGQSLTRAEFPLRANIEWSVGAILDYLAQRADIDASRFGIWGRSVGGHTAPRAAAFDSRLKACVSIGGFYDWPWERFRPRSREEFAFCAGAKTLEEAAGIVKEYTMTGIIDKVKVPMLVIHSQGDKVSSYEGAVRMAREAGGPTKLLLFPEGNHVCDNIPYKVRPYMADWLARQLGLSAARK